VYLKNKEIMKVKTTNKITYAEAASSLAARNQIVNVERTITEDTENNAHYSLRVGPGISDTHTASSVTGTETHFNLNPVLSPTYCLSNPPSTTSTPARQHVTNSSSNYAMPKPMSNILTCPPRGDKDPITMPRGYQLFINIIYSLIELSRLFLPSSDIIGNLEAIIQNIAKDTTFFPAKSFL